MNSIDLFVKNWCNSSSMVPINEQDIKELESKFAVYLPESYKYLISTFGLVRSPNVFSKIIDLNSDLTEVQDFLSLEDVYSLSKLYEMTGMPKGHMLFASDSNGNMFCFKLVDCERQQNDVAVWFYHHELCNVEKISDSFIGWLDKFNELNDL